MVADFHLKTDFLMKKRQKVVEALASLIALSLASLDFPSCKKDLNLASIFLASLALKM